jgi:hypothetical protein
MSATVPSDTRVNAVRRDTQAPAAPQVHGQGGGDRSLGPMPDANDAIDGLWPLLPPPCRVLVVGRGHDALLRQLNERGYAAVGLAPGAAGCGLESFGPAAQPFDLLVLLGCARQLAPLALFEAADRLLRADDARMIVVDEFVLARCADDVVGLHALATFQALAQRMGWEVLHDDRVHAAGMPGTDTGSDASGGGTAGVRREPATHGHHRLSLRRSAPPPFRLGVVAAAQSEAMRTLFAEVFGTPMSAAEWHWKYGDGRGQAVGLWRDHELVAHYGAAARAVCMDGEQVLACQVGDVMVRPDANAGLGRQGALQQVAATLLEQSIGWGLAHRLAFGFPSGRHMKIAHRLRLYAAVDEVVQLQWDTERSPRWSDRWWFSDEIDPAALRRDTPDGRTLENLWHAMRRAMPRALLPVRDLAWLQHRFGRRPGVTYRLYLQRSRLGFAPMGAFVLREHEQHVELMDLVGPPARFGRLVAAARSVAARQGRARLETWVTRSHAALLNDPDHPVTPVDIDVIVPTCLHTPGPSADSLRGRWFLMSGDTDFR